MISEEEAAVEAVLLSAVEPVPPGLLGELLEKPAGAVEELCAHLAASYQEEGRGFRLTKVAGGYRLHTAKEMAPYVERFALEGVSQRLSAAALETLAIIAYKQPVTRGQISALRGVNCDGVARLLEQRGYIEVVGTADGPGKPSLYGTTPTFLERLGINSLDDLPPAYEALPGSEALGEVEGMFRAAGPGD